MSTVSNNKPFVKSRIEIAKYQINSKTVYKKQRTLTQNINITIAGLVSIHVARRCDIIDKK